MVHEVKKKYEPTKRQEKHQKEKVKKAEMNKKLGTGNIDELMEERQVHKFLNIENSKKKFKAEWYNKNSEMVKERQTKYYADHADEINMKLRRKYNPTKRKDHYNKGK